MYVQYENVTAIKLGFHLNNETLYVSAVLSILSQLNILSHKNCSDYQIINQNRRLDRLNNGLISTTESLIMS